MRSVKDWPEAVRAGCVCFVLANGLLLMAVGRAVYTVPARPGLLPAAGNSSDRRCPTPVDIYGNGGATSDEQGTVFAEAFVAKRKWGSWEATVELGQRASDHGSSFVPSGDRFVVPCSWAQTWLWSWAGHSFELLDGEDRLLASVESEPFAWGWSLKVRDCAGDLLAAVEVRVQPDQIQPDIPRVLLRISLRVVYGGGVAQERKSLLPGHLDLAIADGAGAAMATSDFEWNILSPSVITFHDSAAGGGVVGRARSAVHLGTAEWDVYGSGAGGGDARVLGAIVAYKTWKDKSCGKNCHGDFHGVCAGAVAWLEVLGLVLALALLGGLGLGCDRLREAGAARWRRRRENTRRRTIAQMDDMHPRYTPEAAADRLFGRGHALVPNPLAPAAEPSAWGQQRGGRITERDGGEVKKYRLSQIMRSTMLEPIPEVRTPRLGEAPGTPHAGTPPPPQRFANFDWEVYPREPYPGTHQIGPGDLPTDV
jgi:hypothetical protein